MFGWKIPHWHLWIEWPHSVYPFAKDLVNQIKNNTLWLDLFQVYRLCIRSSSLHFDKLQEFAIPSLSLVEDINDGSIINSLHSIFRHKWDVFWTHLHVYSSILLVKCLENAVYHQAEETWVCVWLSIWKPINSVIMKKKARHGTIAYQWIRKIIFSSPDEK